MKKVYTLKFLFLFSFLFLFTKNNFSQCLNQITHDSGTMEVNGIMVTVTPSGLATTTTFCDDANPFWIGGNSNGSYTFEFDPPIDSLSLNVSSIHHSDSFEEILIINVNGELCNGAN